MIVSCMRVMFQGWHIYAKTCKLKPPPWSHSLSGAMPQVGFPPQKKQKQGRELFRLLEGSCETLQEPSRANTREPQSPVSKSWSLNLVLPQKTLCKRALKLSAFSSFDLCDLNWLAFNNVKLKLHMLNMCKL